MALRDDLDWAGRAGVDLTDPATVRAFLLSRFEGWALDLRRLPEECGNLLDALARYEATMLPRAAANAAGAHEGLTSAITAHPDFDHDPHPADTTVG